MSHLSYEDVVRGRVRTRGVVLPLVTFLFLFYDEFGSIEKTNETGFQRTLDLISDLNGLLSRIFCLLVILFHFIKDESYNRKTIQNW